MPRNLNPEMTRTPPNDPGLSTPTRFTHLGKRAGMAVCALWHPHRIGTPDITRHLLRMPHDTCTLSAMVCQARLRATRAQPVPHTCSRLSATRCDTSEYAHASAPHQSSSSSVTLPSSRSLRFLEASFCCRKICSLLKLLMSYWSAHTCGTSWPPLL